MTKLPCLTFSAGSAGSASDLSQPDLFGQSPSVSENHIAKPSSESTGPTRRSSTMSAPSPQMDLEESTSLRAAGRANLGVRPGSSEAQQMTVTSGRKWLALLQSYNLNGLLARTCEVLLVNQWGSSAAFLTWKASATKPRHLLFQLAPSMPRTGEIGSGLLHTPTSTANQMAPSMKNRDPGSWWPTPTASEGTGAQPNTGRAGGSSLRETVKLWATPTAAIAVGSTCQVSKGKRDLRLEVDGQLNPTWVEWLMGFPIGWTDLKPSEMPLSRKSSRKSGGRSSQRSTRDER